MRFLIDMNLTPRWVRFFEEAGHICMHWSATGRSDTPDVEICAYAREQNYILVTNDLDFPQILAYTAEAKPSVILLRGEPLTPESRGRVLLGAITDCASDLAAGAILTIDWLDRPRARVLPLK